ncbi:MAG TPA: medium chain dehydrogenase/reductase family protein [Polyangiaceae bacterium]|nr:medium chain dehydrogenase/reductase family protein [Polyangiaceae bacterium]
MKRITIDKPGGYSRLRLVEGASPTPGPAEVLVETAGIGVNFADVVVRIGLYPSAKKYVGWPITPGFEFSGRVRAVGEDVRDLAVGSEVFGVTRFGAYASELCVPRSQVFAAPTGVPLATAGALPVPFLTAYYGLIVLGAAASGKSVLVHSAAGGVGGALVQLGRLLGCRVVGVVGSAHKVEAARALGADVVIDKSAGNWFEQARAAAGEGFDVALDANGYETLRQSYRLLRPTGRLVIYGAHSMLSRGSARPNWAKLAWTYLRTPVFHPLQLTNDNKGVTAFNLSYLFEEQELLGGAMTQLAEWFSSGRLRPPQVQQFPLAEVGRAHEALQSGKTVGRLLLVP